MSSQQYYNPYSGATLWEFILQLIKRFWGFITGELSADSLVSDEIQIIVLIGVAISSALVGTFLILRKMTMLANSLSHTILIGIVVVYIFTHDGVLSENSTHLHSINIPAMLIASFVMGLITTFLTETLIKVARLQEDASTGLVFTGLFALGITAVTVFTKNAHVGTEVVMGNVDALQLDDYKLVYIILAINLAISILFLKEFKVTTFDPGLSRALGISPVFFNYLLMVQVSSTTIGAFRAVGVLLVLAFICGPALTARLLSSSLEKMLLLAVLFGIVSSVLGVAISRHILSVYGIPYSTAGIVVCTIASIYLLVALFTQYFRFKWMQLRP